MAGFPLAIEGTPLFDEIPDPQALRALPVTQLPLIAAELRERLLDSVARSGGHLAANLGVVELAIALHYVFDTPEDRLIWDVGHQGYPHKILTGRGARLRTIRCAGGLAPFPKRAESRYDPFGVGHSSTSISAALGMSLASQLRGAERQAVAVIGDGAMTAGMAYEALHHAGGLKSDLLMVLNDNEMSISPNVGAISAMLAKALSSPAYGQLRAEGKRVLEHMPPISRLARRAKEQVKGMIVPGTFFEELGIHYFGPVDGHDVISLVTLLRNLRARRGPKLLHVVTQKGKGYPPAEENPVVYHGVKPFDPSCGVKESTPGAPSYTEVFGRWICDRAERDARLVAITPAMREGSGLVEFAERFPERFFDVAIAEQHAVTLAAGMACEGLRPVVAIYSTFLQRAYDQLIHDVALQNLPVLFAIDRAGLVGPDGPTHAGSFDLSFLRCIPNLALLVPADENEARQMLDAALAHEGPAAVRYPRGRGPGVTVERVAPAPLPWGRAELRRRGKEIAILAFGSGVAASTSAAEALDATLVNMRFVKPLDQAIVSELAASHRLLVSVEENTILGGGGAAVAELLSEQGSGCRLLRLGLPDQFVEHGSREECLAQVGLDSAGIEAAVRGALETR